MKRMFPMILLFALLLCVPVRADELTLDAPSALLFWNPWEMKKHRGK